MQVSRLFGLGCQEVSALPSVMSSKHSVVCGTHSYLDNWHKPPCNVGVAQQYCAASEHCAFPYFMFPLPSCFVPRDEYSSFPSPYAHPVVFKSPFAAAAAASSMKL